MFTEVKTSGLPVYLKDDENLLAFLAPLLYQGYGRKVTRQMDGLLYKMDGANPDEAYYDVYRDVRFAADEALLRKDEYQYDFTLIMPGQINGECKKTSGHYHGYNPDHAFTYPEVYEVLSGTAIFVLQRADNFEGEAKDLKIEDIIMVKVETGQSIIIPPNYGHASINGGDGVMLFSNLAYKPCKVLYDMVKRYDGMAYFAFRENGKLSFRKNDKYKNVPMPEVKFAAVRENPRLGIKFGVPIYKNYTDNPEAFRFLGHPDEYLDEIMSMLAYVDSL